jgi:hypothetical protein
LQKYSLKWEVCNLLSKEMLYRESLAPPIFLTDVVVGSQFNRSLTVKHFGHTELNVLQFLYV